MKNKIILLLLLFMSSAGWAKDKPYGIIPGMYRSGSSYGAEVTLMKESAGVVFGADRFSSCYLEAELNLAVLTFSAGVRSWKGHVVPQTTVALPWFFVFPYARWVDKSMLKHNEDISSEAGFMFKIPLAI